MDLCSRVLSTWTLCYRWIQVAHELMHGITRYSSALEYRYVFALGWINKTVGQFSSFFVDFIT